MIRLNRLTDYAIVVLSTMSRSVGRVHAAPALAEQTGVPLPTVAKILKALGQAGVVSSHRGAAGGFSLDRPADAISVAAIIQALEGPIALTACVDGSDSSCGVESLCPMRGNWNRVNTAIREALEGVTLADMIDPALMFPVRSPPPIAARAGS